MCVYIYVCVCVCVCMYVCVYMCVCVCVYIYIPSLPSPHSIPLDHHRAGLPVLSSSFFPATNFADGSI